LNENIIQSSAFYFAPMKSHGNDRAIFTQKLRLANLTLTYQVIF